MKDLKYFNTNDDYTTSKSNFTYPTVSYVEEDTKVYYKEKPGPPVVTYTTTGASQQVKLVNNGEYLESIRIYESDKVSDIALDNGPMNYTFSEPGEHQVELKFKDDATTLASGFSGCSALTSIPDNLFNNCTAVTTFDSTFRDCSGLTSIPENLFSNCTAVTSFDSTFYSCHGLTGSIPENLFSNNTAVTNFSSTFYTCHRLTGSIPENLFSNNTEVTNFSSTFYLCTGLTGSIPANLFSNNTAVTNFSYAFYCCIGLTNIPENLFSNNTAVTTFESTFNSCPKLIGTVPTDSDGTPIYKRSTPGKEGYAIVTNSSDCFLGCKRLTDYSSIPTDWK